MSNSTLPAEYAQKVAQAVQIADRTITLLEAEKQAAENQLNNAREMIPACVDALIQAGVYDAEQREKLATALQTPANVISMLTKLAAKRTQLGQPNTPARGGQPAMRESDRRFLTGIGLM